jgi:hypothetical protein
VGDSCQTLPAKPFLAAAAAAVGVGETEAAAGLAAAGLKKYLWNVVLMLLLADDRVEPSQETPCHILHRTGTL